MGNQLVEQTVSKEIVTFVYVIITLTDWVVQLGPPTFNGTYYQYSVVTDPFSANLFVLARNVTEFKQKYDEDVTTILKQQGFTKFYNKPIETYQGNDCMYIKPF